MHDEISANAENGAFHADHKAH